MFLIIAILAFCVLIIVHELGHYTAGKLLNVRVNEFSFGMGPAIWKKQGKETLYAVRCLPIGGYCAFEGEDGDTGDPRGYAVQAWWKKCIILVAGCAANFLLGFLILCVVFFQAWGFNTTVIDSVDPASPYAEDFQPGDEIISVDGHRTWFSGNVSLYLSRSATGVHDIVLERGGECVELENYAFTPYEGENGMTYGLGFGATERTFFNTFKYSFYSALDFVRQVWIVLCDLVSGLVGLDEMAGVVGIVDLINDVGNSTAESSGMGVALMDVAYLVAFIAVNLAVMNMLPIPALDGCRLLFVLLNALMMLVARRRIPDRYEGYIHAAGMVCMLALMVVIMYNDISRLIVQ